VFRLLVELSRQAVPALVFDFHGQFGTPDNPYVPIANPMLIDAAQGLPFSPFECTSDNTATGWNATALAISEIFAYVCGLGDMQRDALMMCVRDAYRAFGFAVEAAGERPDRYPDMQDVLRRLERAEQQRHLPNLVARCRPLLEMDLFQPVVERQINLIETIRRGLVVDLHNLYSETLQQAVGAFLLRKVYRDMFRWGTADRLRLIIVLDEAHCLARDITLPKIMKEGRKFGVAVVVASQGLRDFHQDVLGTAGTKIAFRANYPESRKVAGFFRASPGTDLAPILEGLPLGKAIVQTPEMPIALRVTMWTLSEQRR
jgi:hypothetical protein